jgi:tRNA pseudouridine38-40 synthase
MDHLVRSYLKAWEEKDFTLLSEILHPKFTGIRTFFEERLYDLEEVRYVLQNPRKIKYEILDIDHKMTMSYVDCYLNVNGENELVTLKFSYEDNLIDRVYETKRLVGKKRIKCIVSYDGSMFDGYQKQPHKRTIQGEIEQALFTITKEKILIHSSGRTDKGVHALNQVFHFDTASKINPDTFYQVINKELPDDIYIKSSCEVHETFHSRYDIATKEYYYIINKKEYDVIKRNYEWYPEEFDEELFKKSLLEVVGRYDFSSFTKTNESNNVRTVYDVRFVENEHYLYIYIKGSGFLRYMIRNLVGSAMAIAKHRTTYTMTQILMNKDNTIIKDIAPSSGLYMNKVTYYE